MNNYDYEDVDRLDRLAERDDSERRGDSLLDEETFMRPQQCWDVRMGSSGTVWIRLVPGMEGGRWENFAPDEARNLANAILSEMEIESREGTGDW